jgi:F/Y-rich N-terminus
MEHKYEEKTEEYLAAREKVEGALKELRALQRRRNSMLDLLLYLRQSKDSPEDFVNGGEREEYPLVLGKAHSKFSVTSIGILPPEEDPDFYSEKFIYPPGFKSKRRHLSTLSPGHKVLYHCEIKSSGGCIFEIRSEGRVWRGEREDVWSRFKDACDKVGCESIEEFFGLAHETVQRLVEEMGDVSQYKGYIPLSLRTSRKKRKRE